MQCEFASELQGSLLAKLCWKMNALAKRLKAPFMGPAQPGPYRLPKMGIGITSKNGLPAGSQPSIPALLKR
eukprot:scaffold8331_cov14-Tisochrysis_lutea.AAC.1